MNKNQINPSKLLNSKWTAVAPRYREKHFLVTKVEFDELGVVVFCELEAIISRRTFPVDWRELQNVCQWHQGWK